MPCYYPLKGWLSNEVNPSGKRSIVFTKSSALTPAELKIPCGQCWGCRLERSRQWAIRCVHEASLYEKNCFITLTFNDQNLNKSGSLVKRDFVLFMKRLRKMYGPKIRFFHCGEYGSTLARPHHHACIFNFDFPDKILYTIRDKIKLYRSQILETLWPYGFCTIGDVTFDSAAYVARYIMKKINSNKFNPKYQSDHYQGKLPEYVTMSRRPGIGRDWYLQFKSDLYPHGYAVIRSGIKCRIPKYYEKMFDITDPECSNKLRLQRSIKAFQNPDNTPQRLRVIEDVNLTKVCQLKRGLENDSRNLLGV